jgi:hypothetical protein
MIHESEAAAVRTQIEILKQQVLLEEADYKYALELQKDYVILNALRTHIRELKERVYALIKTTVGVKSQRIR